MDLPPPRASLAGCMWLPRILAKARLLQSGALPPDYAARFCHPTGVDGQFLSFFGLTKDDILAVGRLADDAAALRFEKLTSSRPGIISQWNDLAQNLGKTGFPMAERLPVALASIYQNLDPAKIGSIFEAIEADESAS
jgi:hypothetical protein